MARVINVASVEKIEENPDIIADLNEGDIVIIDGQEYHVVGNGALLNMKTGDIIMFETASGDEEVESDGLGPAYFVERTGDITDVRAELLDTEWTEDEYVPLMEDDGYLTNRMYDRIDPEAIPDNNEDSPITTIPTIGAPDEIQPSGLDVQELPVDNGNDNISISDSGDNYPVLGEVNEPFDDDDNIVSDDFVSNVNTGIEYSDNEQSTDVVVPTDSNDTGLSYENYEEETSKEPENIDESNDLSGQESSEETVHGEGSDTESSQLEDIHEGASGQEGDTETSEVDSATIVGETDDQDDVQDVEVKNPTITEEVTDALTEVAEELIDDISGDDIATDDNDDNTVSDGEDSTDIQPETPIHEQGIETDPNGTAAGASSDTDTGGGINENPLVLDGGTENVGTVDISDNGTVTDSGNYIHNDTVDNSINLPDDHSVHEETESHGKDEFATNNEEKSHGHVNNGNENSKESKDPESTTEKEEIVLDFSNIEDVSVTDVGNDNIVVNMQDVFVSDTIDTLPGLVEVDNDKENDKGNGKQNEHSHGNNAQPDTNSDWHSVHEYMVDHGRPDTPELITDF